MTHKSNKTRNMSGLKQNQPKSQKSQTKNKPLQPGKPPGPMPAQDTHKPKRGRPFGSKSKKLVKVEDVLKHLKQLQAGEIKFDVDLTDAFMLTMMAKHAGEPTTARALIAYLEYKAKYEDSKTNFLMGEE